MIHFTLLSRLLRLWASWAASSLASQLRDTVDRDDVFSLAAVSVTPLSWQQVVVSMSGGAVTDGAAALLMSSSGPGASPSPAGGGDGQAGDMRFWLPASPSPAAMALLEAACQEARRAGDHAAAAEALQVGSGRAGHRPRIHCLMWSLQMPSFLVSCWSPPSGPGLIHTLFITNKTIPVGHAPNHTGETWGCEQVHTPVLHVPTTCHTCPIRFRRVPLDCCDTHEHAPHLPLRPTDRPTFPSVHPTTPLSPLSNRQPHLPLCPTDRLDCFLCSY